MEKTLLNLHFQMKSFQNLIQMLFYMILINWSHKYILLMHLHILESNKKKKMKIQQTH